MGQVSKQRMVTTRPCITGEGKKPKNRCILELHRHTHTEKLLQAIATSNTVGSSVFVF